MLTTLETRFANLAATGYKKPHLRAEGFILKMAPATGSNPGAVYVTHEADGQYLGKIMRGNIMMIADHVPLTPIIKKIADNPQDAALRYGHRTGRCAVCGRPLDNKESVAAGIGPICAEKYGWLGNLIAVPFPDDDIDWDLL